jgi:GcrA cell cycle regulator
MTRNADKLSWTDALVATLRQLWAEGHPVAEIGRLMGISKNAVVGKAHRLNLPSRPNPVKASATPRQVKAKRAPAATLAPIAAPVAVVAFRPRRASTCCWIDGDRPNWRHCDAPATAGSYCATHASVAYVARKPRAEAVAA